MADMTVRSATAPLTSGTGPQQPVVPPSQPAQQPPATTAPPKAGTGMLSDSTVPARRPGTSNLTLPGTGNLNPTAGTATPAASTTLKTQAGNIGTVANVTNNAQKIATGVQKLEHGDVVGGVSDLSSGVKGLSNAGALAVDASHGIATKVGQVSENVTKAATTASTTLKSIADKAGTAGAVVGMVTSGVNVAKGVNEIEKGIQDGNTQEIIHGAATAAGGMIGEMQSGLTVAKAAGAAGLISKGAATAATNIAGKIAAPLAIAGGVVQAAAALSAHPPDMKSAAVGAMNAVGGALMMVPGGQVAGAALMVGAAVIDNWGAISGAASKAAGWVSSWFGGK